MVPDIEVAAGPDDILDPVGEVDNSDWVLADRLDTLTGATIGLLDTRKTNADVFLEAVGETLTAEFDVETTIYRSKANGAAPAGDALTRLLEECDAIVNAYGDCGSCTSWCVHDSVVAEKAGLPTATVNSDEFVRLGQSESRALGLPGLPIVAVEHPLGDADRATVRLRAETAIPELVEALTRNADELAAAYDGRYIDAEEPIDDSGFYCPIGR